MMQEVGDLSYSDYTKDNFDCGRGELLCEINGEECGAKAGAKEEDQEMEGSERARRQTEAEEEEEEYSLFRFSADDKSFFCGATIINDR